MCYGVVMTRTECPFWYGPRTRKCRLDALSGAHLLTIGARVRCASAEHRSADMGAVRGYDDALGAHGSRRLEKRDQRVEIPDHDPHSRASSDDERDRHEQAANTHRLIGPDLSFPIVVIDLPHTSTDPLAGTRVTTSTTRGPPQQIGRCARRR
jgi:hypothetical protein